jgi:hypothetical protein
VRPVRESRISSDFMTLLGKKGLCCHLKIYEKGTFMIFFKFMVRECKREVAMQWQACKREG